MTAPAASLRYCSRCLTTFEADAAWCVNPSCTNERPAEGWGLILGPGDEFDRNYRVIRHLAIGGGGITYVAREIGADGRDTGPLLAIKVLYAGRDQGSFLKRLANEARILQELNHPHIVECEGFVQRAGRPPYLLTRFEEGGNLFEHVARCGPLPLGVVVQIGRQICQALELAHSRGVVHRDMKPENILLAAVVPRGLAPHVRVADFGIAKVQNQLGGTLTRAGAFVGTPAFAAPEQLRGQAPTPAADIFGLAGVLYFCATGAALVYVPEYLSWEDRADALEAALPPMLPASLGGAPELAGLERALQAAMTVDPGRRCSAAQLDALLAAALGQGAAPEDDRSTMAFGRDDPPEVSPTAPAPAAHTRWQPPPSRPPAAPAVPPPAAQAPRRGVAQAGPSDTAWFAASPPPVPSPGPASTPPTAPPLAPAASAGPPPRAMMAALLGGGLLALIAAAGFTFIALRMAER